MIFRPFQEILARGNAARLLELATIQASKNFEKVPVTANYQAFKRKRQISDIFRGFQPGGRNSQFDYYTGRSSEEKNRFKPR